MSNKKLDIRSILLLGTENDLALSAIRGLHSAFPYADIFTASRLENAFRVAESSKYISKSFYFDYGIEEPAKLRDSVTGIIEKTNAQVLIPIDEEYLLFLSRYKDFFKAITSIPPMSDTEVLNSLILKNQLSQTLESIGLPYAKTVSFKDEDLGKLEWDSYPCIMKPGYGLQAFLVDRVNSFVEVQNKLRREATSELIDHSQGYILQEFIPGYNIDCSFLAADGEIKAFTVQKGIVDSGLRYSVAVEFLHSDAIREYVLQLVRKTGFEGIAHLDFRHDERTNELKLIDFNARIWMTISGSKAVGINFMEYLVLSALGIDFDYPDYKDGIYYSGSSSALKGMLKSLSKRKQADELPVHFNLKERLIDPLPELASVWSRLQHK